MFVYGLLMAFLYLEIKLKLLEISSELLPDGACLIVIVSMFVLIYTHWM